MALAVVNAIPDFHQDRLVGKRNLVVRLGRRRAVWLYLGARGGGACWSSPVGVVARRVSRRVPRRAAGAAAARRERARRALRTYESPRAVRAGRCAASSRCYLRRRRAVHRAASCCTPGRSVMNRIDSLQAPLFVSWQLTRDCDLCCLHCCTDSAPGKRLPDELDARRGAAARGRDRRATRCPT